MKQSDFDAFHALLTSCLSMWDKAPSAAVSAVWFRSLAEFDMTALSAAFSAHMRDPVNGKFEPKPAHIIEQIERAAKQDGRPGAEEAWAISLTARDESDTVVWTNECAQAWSAAKPVMDMGDEVGARMAFKETYSRLVAEARSRFEAASWEVSEGFDSERRRIAVARAVEAGRIPAGRYAAIEHITPLMLSGPAAGGIPEAVRQKLAELREQFTRPYEGPSEADLERERLAELKRAQAQKVEQFMRGGDAA
jgi:hypothetical protein